MESQLLHGQGDIVNGRYKITEGIGHGATGEVFVAEDPLHPEKKIAVKYLKLASGKIAALEQFKSEFATLTHLSHPHIAKVYDFEQDSSNNQFFFTSELVEGVEFLKAVESMQIDEIESLFVQSLRALEYLHSNGIFHFDVKSANLLVSGNNVKLIDFGLATIRFQGRLAGTPSYMAPEMVRRENPDGRADLYSLGVLIYSSLTKYNPFRAKDMDETLKNQLKLIPQPPSTLNSGVPGYLDTIIMRLLEKRADDRYQTAAQVIHDLNLRSPQKYSIETEETRDSYIPLESKFIGRTKEIEQVTSLLKAKKSGVVVVRGGNGSGKSRFLNEIKYLAQIEEWTTFFSADMAKIEEAKNHPTVIGIDDYHVVSHETWGVKVKEIIEGVTRHITLKPTIVLLSMDEVAKIPDGLDSKDVVEVILSNFTTDEIKEYLTALTGLTNPPQSLIEQIYTNTGGNPYIVSEIIKTLVTEGTIVDAQGRWKESTFDDIKINVEKLQIPLSAEERLIGGFSDLPQDAKSLAEMMAVIGRPVSVNEAAEISGNETAKGALLMLTRRGIVKYRVADGTYYFTRPIACGAIYHRMKNSERAAWHDKIASHMEHGTLEHETWNIETLEHETWNIETLYHQSRGSNTDLAKSSLAKLIEIQIKALKNQEAALNAQFYLERWDDNAIKLQLARLYNRLGKYDLAIQTADSVLEHGTLEHGTLEHHVSALETIGIAYLRHMNFNSARQNFTTALGLASKLLVHQQLRLQNFLAEVEYFEGNIDKSIEIYERTAEESEKLPHSEQLLIRNNNLGQAYFQKGDYKKAVSRLEKDLELYKDSDDKRLLGRTKYMLAESYRISKAHGKAVSTFNDLVEYSKSVNDLEHLFRAYNGLGNLYNDDKDYKQALVYYERALDISSRLGDDEQSISCIANMGVIASNIGEVKKAYNFFSSALAFLESDKASGGIMEQYHCRMHLELGEICRIYKDYNEANKHLTEALNIANTISNKDFLFWIRFVQARVAMDSNDKTAKKSALAEAEKLADTDEKKSKLKEIS